MQNFEEISKQLELLNKKIEANNEIQILKARDISRILGINMNQACSLFKRSDFPALTNCGDNKIEKKAFLHWLQNRHSDYDNEQTI